MSPDLQSVLGQLFGAQKQPGQRCHFTWYLIQRQRRPFLLLPVTNTNSTVSLTLYSAQRRLAKILRALLPLMLRTPAALIFQRITLPVGENSELLRFLSEQSGVPVNLLSPPAIKFGAAGSHISRLVLLVCDAANRPLKVVKVGLDNAGRAAIETEANQLAQLPANTLGCIRVTGRLTTPNFSAFCTDYFAGESPENDIGMEILFHSWLNPGPMVPVESLANWQELAAETAATTTPVWPALCAALTGQSLHSTLRHGDFAPWNIRAVNTQNLQAFDWESGSLRGIPGWDWFHFVVQTSILARRHSVERVAAEVEELLGSPRFIKYAEAAGIQTIAQPLLLAYLLYHRWVVQPGEGKTQAEDLCELLSIRWNFQTAAQNVAAGPAPAPPSPAARPGLLADARWQLTSAASQLANVFWEPTLIGITNPPWWTQLKSAWPVVLFCSLWLALLVRVQYFTHHMILLPLYAIPCLLAAWKINRRWGRMLALISAALGPLTAMAKGPAEHPAGLEWWNIVMRFIILQMCVFLSDRIHWQENFFRQLATPHRRAVNIGRNWAVILLGCLLFLAIAWGDMFTGPRISFLPLYLFPAILITLFLNLRCGLFIALAGALAATFDGYTSRYDADALEAFGWNFPMRFLMLFLVLLLLDELRRKNVLFTPRKPHGNGGAQTGH